MKGASGLQSLRGFSMIEVLVVSSIVALALLPMIDVFRSGSRQLEQTQPYHQAVFLGEKCLEETRLGAEEDPYYLSRLLVDGLGADAAPVTGGRHPFFALLEDAAPPWGRIEAGEDWSIQKECGPLFDQVGSFLVSIQSSLTQNSPPQAPEAEARAVFDWVDKRDQAMRYELGTMLRVWVPLAKVEAPVPAGDDAALGKAIDSASAQGLAAMASARGADPEKLGALARLVANGRAAKDALERTTPLVAAVRAEQLAAPEGPARDTRALQLGRYEEAVAARMVALLQQMRPALESLGRGLTKGSLGNPPPPPELLRETVATVRLALEGAQKNLAAALADDGALAQEPSLPSGWRPSLHLAVLRLAKMAALTYPWSDRKPLHSFLHELGSYYRGRMPNMVHFCEQEEQLVESLDSSWSLAPAARDARQAREAYAAAAMKLLLYIEPPVTP